VSDCIKTMFSVLKPLETDREVRMLCLDTTVRYRALCRTLCSLMFYRVHDVVDVTATSSL